MAGKFRRKFVDIISDKFVDHYRGKVADKDFTEALAGVKKLIGKLEESKKDNINERTKSLKKLKRLPLEKLKEILATEA